MTEPLADTWNSREFPILRETARQLEYEENADGGVRVHQIAAALNLSPEIVYRSVRILESDGLLEGVWMQPSTHGRITQISGRARQLVGQWPTPETAADRLLAALDALASQSPDEPTRTRARTVREQVGGFSRDTLAAIAATIITGQIPGASS